MNTTFNLNRCHHVISALLAMLMFGCWTGCGSTNTRKATEQLLVSDAVDRAVGRIDFRSLAGKSVYFDTKYIRDVKGVGFVNSAYIISALRQHMVAARCQLQDRAEDADVIIEARVGALGTDGHELTFGIPASSALSSAAALFPNAPPIPAIPEISFARSDAQSGAAKIGVFAYYRESKQPVWQSGTSLARSSSKDTWFLGAGPLQRGTIHEGTRFAGNPISLSRLWAKKEKPPQPAIDYNKEILFDPLPAPPESTGEVQFAGFQGDQPPAPTGMGHHPQAPPPENP